MQLSWQMTQSRHAIEDSQARIEHLQEQMGDGVLTLPVSECSVLVAGMSASSERMHLCIPPCDWLPYLLQCC
jgi:hypothetical protein